MQDSIRHTAGWESVDEVLVPSHTQENLIPVGMKQDQTVLPSKPKIWHVADVRNDSLAKAREDSIIIARNDSLARLQSGYGIVLEDPYYIGDKAREISVKRINSVDGGISWILALLAILFCLICFKSKSNSKYFRQLFRDLKETRLRHNMFDSTVRESSFMVLLNITWIVCAGILLWDGVRIYLDMHHGAVPSVSPVMGIMICTAVAAAYKLFMHVAYWVTGYVFSDGKTTREWIKGANSASALESIGLFPLALAVLCYPGGSEWAVIIGAILFGMGKLMFIYKGIRIFFSQIASLLLFLYYFCSLEIIPLIIAFAGALQLIRVV